MRDVAALLGISAWKALKTLAAQTRAETEAQALRLPRCGRILDVRGSKKEPEMADLRISQGNRGDSRVVGEARPEDGEAA